MKTQIFAKLLEVVKKNKSTILTTVEVGGVILTAFLAAKGGIDASKKLEEKAEEKEDGHLEPMEVFKTAAPYYIPAFVAGSVTIGVCLFHNYISLKDAATLLAAYHISEDKLNEFKEAAVRTVGEKKAEDIQDNVAFAAIRDVPFDPDKAVYTGKGKHLCFDNISKDYFYTDMEYVRQAVNDVNKKLIVGDTVTINDFHELLGEFPYWDIGENLGWDLNFRNELFSIKPTSKLLPDGSACMVIDYDVYPIGFKDY